MELREHIPSTLTPYLSTIIVPLSNTKPELIEFDTCCVSLGAVGREDSEPREHSKNFWLYYITKVRKVNFLREEQKYLPRMCGRYVYERLIVFVNFDAFFTDGNTT